MEKRKKEHLHLAFDSAVDPSKADKRFYYEPLLGSHKTEMAKPFDFVGKTMKYPFWISSMTGGTHRAGTINRNLARACGEFGLGMGLGSCRILMQSDDYFSDFNIREYMGNEAPLYTNLGICQLESLVQEKTTDKISKLNDWLKADGIIIHVNPLQEIFQPEGDRLQRPPIETIQEFSENTDQRIIVKEVGQGMGYNSLKALMQLNLEAIEFGALGGTNFSKMEMKRRPDINSAFESMAYLGHTAEEMTQMVNEMASNIQPKVKHIIISGGIKSIIDGYYLYKTCKLNSVVGMGSAFLKHAMEDYNKLQEFVRNLIEAWNTANAFLRVK